ncbi:MAG: M23 family metallopeptidase, partial [Bacteroidales bacterium]|nr:M23 family metallopeptidase [Bacteroidales bacterium]
FNPEDLNYNKLDDSLGARVWRIVIYVAAILVMAILLNVVYSLFFDTPRERQIRRENEMLQEQYNALSERKSQVDTVMQEIQRIDRDIYRVIFETEPVEPEMFPGSGLTYQNLLRTSSEAIVDYTARKSDSMVLHNEQTAALYDVLMIKGENRAEVLPAIPAIQPIENRDLTLIASGYGYRIHPIYKIMKMHEGIDFSAPVGTLVMATADGVVENVTRSGRGLGNRILIDHGYGYKTLYACMEELGVRRGLHVKRGEVIGTVGESGLSVAPHLHYEVHLNGEPVNPINFFFLELSPRDYDRLILISMMSGQSFD